MKPNRVGEVNRPSSSSPVREIRTAATDRAVASLQATGLLGTQDTEVTMKSAKKLLNSARKAERTGNFGEAESLYAQVISEFPGTQEATTATLDLEEIGSKVRIAEAIRELSSWQYGADGKVEGLGTVFLGLVFGGLMFSLGIYCVFTNTTVRWNGLAGMEYGWLFLGPILMVVPLFGRMSSKTTPVILQNDGLLRFPLSEVESNAESGCIDLRRVWKIDEKQDVNGRKLLTIRAGPYRALFEERRFSSGNDYSSFLAHVTQLRTGDAEREMGSRTGEKGAGLNYAAREAKKA